MTGITLHHSFYYALIERINNIHYQPVQEKNRMGVHQTINFLVQHLRIALGETDAKAKPAFWQRLFRKQRDLYWRYTGTTHSILENEFSNKVYESSFFERDRSLLVSKLKKYILQPDARDQVHHPDYGSLSKEEYVLLLLRMIDRYLKPFEMQQGK